jgi:hypothetical protein
MAQHPRPFFPLNYPSSLLNRLCFPLLNRRRQLPAFELLVTDGLNTVPIALELNSTFSGSSSASWFAGARWLAREETSLTAGVFQARAD